MSYRLTDIFNASGKTISFEIFPAKTPEGHARLLETIRALSALGPDFISCTYGAGGGTRERTFDIVQHIQDVYGIPAMAHLTCTGHTRQEIHGILEDFRRRGVVNILALKGDPPQAGSSGKGDFSYASELIEDARTFFGDSVSIGVAGFPEKHVLSKGMDSEAYFLKKKIASGADFIITQLFFDNRRYFEYISLLRRHGINLRVIPGILPITDFRSVERFCLRCGTEIPLEVRKKFEPLADNPEMTKDAGIAFAVDQCSQLLSNGVPGIHLYTLNKVDVISKILGFLKKRE